MFLYNYKYNIQTLQQVNGNSCLNEQLSTNQQFDIFLQSLHYSKLTNAELDTILLKLYKQSSSAKQLIDKAISNSFQNSSDLNDQLAKEITNNGNQAIWNVIIYYGYGTSLSGNEYKHDNPNTGESIIIQALSTLDLRVQFEVEGQNTFKRLGRTDASVSSQCQLCYCKVLKKDIQLQNQHDLSQNKIKNDFWLKETLNKMLNPYIFVYDIVFETLIENEVIIDPRMVCKRRTYKYLLRELPRKYYEDYSSKYTQNGIEQNKIITNEGIKLIEALNTALLAYCGEHDFQYLSYENKPAIRTIYQARVEIVLFDLETGQHYRDFAYQNQNDQILKSKKFKLYLILTVTGKAFAYHQMRILSSIVNKVIIEQNPEVLTTAIKQNQQWKHMEPGQRLCLISCVYNVPSLKAYEGKPYEYNEEKSNQYKERLEQINQTRQDHIKEQKRLQIIE